MKQEIKDIYIDLKIMRFGLKDSKSGIDASGFWSRWKLWNLPTIKNSYNDINEDSIILIQI